MQSLALVVHVLLAVGVIGLVLLQHGKGADAGAAFGSGASATVFGARGSASFLTRATTVLAVLFFLTSLALFYLAANRDRSLRSVTDVPSVTDEAPPPASDLPGGVDGVEAESPAASVGEAPDGAPLTEPVAPEAPTAEDVPAPTDAPAGDDLPAPAD